MPDAEEQSFEYLANTVSNSIYDLNTSIKKAKRSLQLVIRKQIQSTNVPLQQAMAGITSECSHLNRLVDNLNSWPADELSLAQKQQQSALTREYRILLKDVQAFQQTTTTVLQAAMAPARERTEQSHSSEATEQTPLIQVLDQVDQGTLDMHTALVEDREVEIQEIQHGMSEINSIFKDLSLLVAEQGNHLDTIEDNIGSLAAQTSGADRELGKAHEYQKRRSKCTMIVLFILLTITILVSLSFFS